MCGWKPVTIRRYICTAPVIAVSRRCDICNMPAVTNLIG